MNCLALCVITMLTWGLLSANGCDKLQRFKVQLQWARAFSSGHDRADLALAIGRAAVAAEPEVLELLKKHGIEDVDSAAFRAHTSRKLAEIDLLISVLDHPEALKAQLEYLKSSRNDLHTSVKYLTTFKKAFGHAVAAQLGRCFDKTAWGECFDAFINNLAK